MFPLLLIVLFLMGSWLRFYNLGNVRSRSPDESVYTQQAKVALEKGFQGIKWMVGLHGEDRNAWLYPPPTRIGYIFPLALTMKIRNDLSENSGACLSAFFSILSLALVAIFGLRFFNKRTTLYALLFMCVSPVELAMARRSWQDSVFGFIGLLLIGVSYEVTRNFNNRSMQLVFIMIANLCVLVKESGLVLVGICAFFIGVAYAIREKKAAGGAVLFFTLSLGVIPSILLLIYASGGLDPFLSVYKHIAMGVPDNSYALEYQSGPWLRYIGGFWILAPLSTVMFLFALLHILIFREDGKGDMPEFEKNKVTAAGLLLIMLAFFSSTMAISCLQNFRYISPIYGFFYLIAGLGMWHALSYADKIPGGFWRATAASLVIFTVIAGAFYDFNNFQRIFIRTGMRDISIGLIKNYGFRL